MVVFAHRHPGLRWCPDCWDLVGGHVETGESARDAVVRECHEELAVRVHDPRPVPMAFTDPTIEMYTFQVDRWDGEPVNAAPEEHDRIGWFGVAQFAGRHLADAASLPDIVEMARSSRRPPGGAPRR